MKVQKASHFSQVFKLDTPETELDFFDVNLAFDSRLFVDPFLIRNSPIEQESELFKRFSSYFQEAIRQSLEVITKKRKESYLYHFLEFPEPSEVCLGYTERSTSGSGLGSKFTRSMTNLFLRGVAKRIIQTQNHSENNDFDPNIFAVFADGVAEDGISDLTINLIMDFLVSYTQAQCKKYNIETKILPIHQIFNYDEMEWSDGRYFALPENPFKSGEAIVLIPKRFLRASEITGSKVKSKTVSILRQDRLLKERFSSLVSKRIDEIDIEEVRSMLLAEDGLLDRFIKAYEEKCFESPYDFQTDPLEFLAIKTYQRFFESSRQTPSPTNCDDFIKIVKDFLIIFKDEFEIRDAWRDAWIKNEKGKMDEITEPTWGRKLRGMGVAFFSRYPTITFEFEVGTGNGPADFKIVFLDCRVVIEIKKLSNSSPKGEPPIPSYIHGISRQLPQYTINSNAKYAIYLTGQHRYRNVFGMKTDHTSRTREILSFIPTVTQQIMIANPSFVELLYININLSPKPSASRL